MKRLWILLLAIFIGQAGHSQPELFEQWTLHYMVIDGTTYDVAQPHPSDPFYHPSIEFYEDSSGYQVYAFIYFNYMFDSEPPILINPDTFMINVASVTLGDCSPYCDLENKYLSTILSLTSPRTFDYEITEAPNGDKTLVITTPEGNIAVHGNYILGVDSFEKTSYSLYPNPVDNSLTINSTNKLDLKKIRILSPTGKVILVDIATNLNTLDLSFLKSGLYFLEITQDDASRHILKFIKQ